MYWTLAGEICDLADNDDPIVNEPGDDPVTHGPETRHQPQIPRWWIGVFDQPAGSKLAEV